MKISLKNLTNIIKEEIEDVYVSEETPQGDLVARAREEIGTIDLRRAIERGDFDNQTAAAALRMLADEFEAEVDAAGEDKYDRANKKNREDTEWLLKNMSESKTVEDGLHGLWNSIKDRVKEMDEDMDRAAAEEYEKVKAIDKFLDDAKDFVDGWWSGK
jgi:hypothetical protein